MDGDRPEQFPALPAAVVSDMKVKLSFFVFACSYSTLLPGAERTGALYGQQAQTGSGSCSGNAAQAVMGFSPLRGSPGAALIA